MERFIRRHSAIFILTVILNRIVVILNLSVAKEEYFSGNLKTTVILSVAKNLYADTENKDSSPTAQNDGIRTKMTE